MLSSGPYLEGSYGPRNKNCAWFLSTTLWSYIEVETESLAVDRGAWSGFCSVHFVPSGENWLFVRYESQKLYSCYHQWIWLVLTVHTSQCYASVVNVWKYVCLKYNILCHTVVVPVIRATMRASGYNTWCYWTKHFIIIKEASPCFSQLLISNMGTYRYFSKSVPLTELSLSLKCSTISWHLSNSRVCIIQ